MESAMTALQKYRIFNVKETGREFGRGSYGAVVEVNYKGLICAAKKMHPVLYEQGVGDLVHRFVEECKLLSELQHPRIVQFVGIWFESEKSRVPVLVMEFLPTTLAQCVEQHGHLPEEIAYSVLRDVALGLRYLHERPKPIIHRDLSANNVLLTEDMRAKISDLGVAKILDHLNTKKMTKGPGNLSYMPPETMARNPRYDSKVDIFSYGVMMVHVFSGQWPEPSESVVLNDKGNLIAVSEAGRRQKYLDDIGHGHLLMELILHCLENNPCHRPVIVEVFHQVTDVASRFPPTFSDRIEVLERMKFEAAEKQRIIDEKDMEIRHLKDEKALSPSRQEVEALRAQMEQLQADLESRETQIREMVAETQQKEDEIFRLMAELRDLQSKLQIPVTQEPTPNPINYYDILLLGKTGTGKTTTGYKMLGLSKTSSDLSVTSQCKVLSSEEVMRLRILDVPGFPDSDKLSESDGIHERNLEIFHSIIRIQAALEMKFRRIVYFLPCRGVLEKVDSVLRELKMMYHYFGKNIFECMVLAGTNPSSTKIQRLEIEFEPQDIKSSQEVFQMAMRMATGDETLLSPPLVYIGLSPQYTGEKIIRAIRSAHVQSDEGLQLKIHETEDIHQC